MCFGSSTTMCLVTTVGGSRTLVACRMRAVRVSQCNSMVEARSSSTTCVRGVAVHQEP